MRWLLWSLSGLTACGASIDPSAGEAPSAQPALAPRLETASATASSTAIVPASTTSLRDEVLTPTGAPAEEALAGFAAVWGDAEWFVAPKADARSFKLASFKDSDRRKQLELTVPVRILKVHGDFVEVSGSPLADELNLDPVCSRLILGAGSFTNVESSVDLHLFVRRRDLAPVVTKRFEHSFADGSAFEVQPGTNVLRTSEGVLLKLHDGSVRLPIELPVGHSFAAMPPKPRSPRVSDGGFILSGVSDVRLAGRPVDWSGLSYSVVPSRVQPNGERTLVSLDGRCINATLSAPAAAVTSRTPGAKDDTADAFGVGGLGISREPHWVLPRGSKLSCDVASSTLTLKMSRRMDEKAEPCIDVPIRISSYFFSGPSIEPSEQTMRCCAPRGTLVKVTPPPMPPGFGLGTLGRGQLGGGKKPKPDPMNSRE